MQLLKQVKKRLGRNPCVADGCHRRRDPSGDQNYPFCTEHDWNNGTARLRKANSGHQDDTAQD